MRWEKNTRLEARKNRNLNFSEYKFERVRYGSRFGVEVGKRKEKREESIKRI